MCPCRFDGDGMLHAVRIKAGKASFSNAFVQTSLYKQEKRAGRAISLKVWLLWQATGSKFTLLRDLT